MKILLYCLPRTRSSFLQDVVSQYYNLENIFEPYKPTEFACTHKVFWLKPEIIGANFKKEVKKVSDTLLAKDNFCAKLFPLHTYNAMMNLWRRTDNFAVTPEVIFDLDKDHNIRTYDKIFVLKRRNLADFFCSYYFAYERAEFTFTKEVESFVEIYRPKNKIKVNPDYKIIKAHVVDLYIMEYQHNWLKKNNIPTIDLDYDDVPNYVAEHYPNIQSKHIETKYNYKDFLLNYDEILEQVEKAKKELNLDYLLSE